MLIHHKMDRSSNDGIYIMFTESHEILPNFIGVIDVMHEIHMNVGIKRLTLILKLEFATTTNEIQRNW